MYIFFRHHPVATESLMASPCQLGLRRASVEDDDGGIRPEYESVSAMPAWAGCWDEVLRSLHGHWNHLSEHSTKSSGRHRLKRKTFSTVWWKIHVRIHLTHGDRSGENAVQQTIKGRKALVGLWCTGEIICRINIGIGHTHYGISWCFAALSWVSLVVTIWYMCSFCHSILYIATTRGSDESVGHWKSENSGNQT